MSGGRLVSTLDVPERDRLSYWVDAVCAAFLELEVDSSAGPAFDGMIETFPVGPLAVNLMRFDDQRIRRSPQAISRGKVSELYLIQSRDTPVRFSQLGREIELEAGGCTLIDSRYPFTIENGCDRDTVSVSIPTGWLLTWLPAPEDVVARTWLPGAGWGGVLASAVRNLTPGQLAAMPLPGSVLCDQFGALLALAGSEASGSVMPVRTRSTLLDRLRDSLRGSFQDPALSPAQVARHHGISLRYLHLQFASAGSSFGAELLAIRLEAGNRMLADSRQAGLTVMEVAFRCGFANASHFARRFSQRYGHSPREFRTLCRT